MRKKVGGFRNASVIEMFRRIEKEPNEKDYSI